MFLSNSVVCPACRLVQQRAPVCVCCGDPYLATLAEAPERFLQPRTRIEQRANPLSASTRGWHMWLTVLLGAPLIFIAGAWAMLELAPDLTHSALAWVGMVLLGFFPLFLLVYLLDNHRRARFWHDATVTSTVPLFVSEGPWIPAVAGVVRPLEKSVTSHLEGEACLVASLAFDDSAADPRGVYLRSLRAVPFVVQPDDHSEPVLVEGSPWLAGSAPAAVRQLHHSAELLDQLGIRQVCRVPVGAREYLLREGDRVELSGELVDQARAQLAAGYRDGGRARTIGSTVGKPLQIRRVTERLD